MTRQEISALNVLFTGNEGFSSFEVAADIREELEACLQCPAYTPLASFRLTFPNGACVEVSRDMHPAWPLRYTLDVWQYGAYVGSLPGYIELGDDAAMILKIPSFVTLYMNPGLGEKSLHVSCSPSW